MGQDMSRQKHRTCLTVGLSLVCVAHVAAQVEAAGDTVCVNAAQLLSVSASGREVTNALAALTTCPESGPQAIVAFWLTRPHDSGVRRSLAEVTGRFQDRRLHAVARSVLLDKTANEGLRIAALAAVATHGDPCFAVHIRPEPTSAPGGSAYVMLGWRNDALTRRGSEAFPGGMLADVIDLIQNLAKTEPDTPTGKVTALVAAELRRSGGTRPC
jgi:hypothetical protein